MIIKIVFNDDVIQYISCSTKVGRKINCIQKGLLKLNYSFHSLKIEKKCT